MEKTLDRIREIFEECLEFMRIKNHDYGESWRWMRLTSITDQMLVKIFRIRTLESKEQKCPDSVRGEYIDIINYCFFALFMLDAGRERDDW